MDVIMQSFIKVLAYGLHFSRGGGRAFRPLEFPLFSHYNIFLFRRIDFNYSINLHLKLSLYKSSFDTTSPNVNPPFNVF